MENIIVGSSDLWDYCVENIDDLFESRHEVASNSDYGTEVYITAEEGVIQIVVEVDDEEVYRENITNQKDCYVAANEVYSIYVTSQALDYLGAEVTFGNNYEKERMEIEEREEELDLLISEFITGVAENKTCCCRGGEDEMLQDIKDHFLEYMARKWGIKIYRPMCLIDEDGDEFYEEYPYECMEFEDEDNPIYKRI